MHESDPFTPGAMPFQGIPQRVLPEDCMEYILFAISPDLSTADLVRSRLLEIQSAAETLVRSHASDYIWQRQSFGLSLESVSDVPGVDWCLKGKTEYGDAVDDEWLIVWLLRELSKKNPELWIRIYDTDGEFLLIEAANVLPRWLNPEIAENRVWVNKGRLYLIPLSASAASASNTKTRPTSRSLTLPEALGVITACDPASLQRIRLVEEEAFFRTSSYPGAAAAHMHHALTTVPRRVAGILRALPDSVAAATEAFYLRDPVSLKAVKEIKWEDTVTVSVKYTKVLYAQLRGQVWEPPFLPAADVKKGGMPVDVGAKLTAGMYMLLKDETSPVSEARRPLVSQVRELAEKAPLPTDEAISAWEKKQDSDDWLNIDFTQFEADLAGKGKEGPNPTAGWGDKEAEENLKNMVRRFESFLNDESAGLEGAELDDEMDEDNDSDLDSDDSDSDEDKEVSFDEAEFSRMMREMMGMPAEPAEDRKAPKDTEDGEVELREITKIQNQIEAELKEAGAIEREKPQPSRKVLPGGEAENADEKESEDENAEVNVDYTLAKNLLESFKGQGGLSGPGGNLLARMGIKLPRDEDDAQLAK